MMEFIYDSQDIYFYYDEIFENKSLMPYTIRKPELPFANFLGNNYYDMLNLLLNSENLNDRNSLLKIRWYNFEEFKLDFSSNK
jgi:hypothetical protein